jgi:hypothetical protein
MLVICICFELKRSTRKCLNGAEIYAQIPVAMDGMIDELLVRSFWLLVDECCVAWVACLPFMSMACLAVCYSSIYEYHLGVRRCPSVLPCQAVSC